MPEGYSGFSKLGEMLVGGGMNDAKREALQAKTMSALAARDANLARASIAIDKARMRSGLGDAYLDLQSDDPAKQAAALATIQRGDFNPQQGTAALGNLQEQRFRQQAVEAPTMGAANKYLMGVANGPVVLADVAGDTLLGNRFVEGGAPVGPTAVGQSRIAANEALARSRDAGPGRRTAVGGNVAAGGIKPAKLSEIDKLRMKADLESVELPLKALRTRYAELSQSRFPEQQNEADGVAQKIKELEAARSAVFDKYDQTPLGKQLVPDADDRTSAIEKDLGRPLTPAERQRMRDNNGEITFSAPSDRLPPSKSPAGHNRIAWTQDSAQAQLNKARKAIASGAVTREEAIRRLRDAGLVNASKRL